MANYTVTKFNTTEAIGDSIFFNNMVTSGTVTITPNSRYVVSASDFSVSSLPTGIASVVFTDNATAGQPGNTVTGTFTFASDFSVTGNVSIGLNMQGDAKVYNPEVQAVSYKIQLIDNTNKNLNGSSSMKDSNDVVIAGSTSSGVTTYSISGNITKNVLTKIAELTINNDTNFYFKDKAYLKYIDLSTSQLKLKQTSKTRDSSNRVTSTTYDVMLRLSSSAKSFSKAIINYNGIATPTDKNEIVKIEYGDTQVSNLGEFRRIKVYGSIGAEFDVTVLKDSSGTVTSILDTDLANVDVLDLTYGGVVRGYNKKISGRIPGIKGMAYCEFSQSFPAGTDKYYINLYTRGTTTFGSNILATYPKVTIEQYANPVLTINAEVGTGTGYTVTTTGRVDHTGKANATPKHLRGTKIPAMFDLTIVATRSGSNTFKTVTNPDWSSTDQTASDWSNSVYADNGGMHIEMFNLKTVYSSGDTIATITATVLIKKWGNATTAMMLDTGKFLTCTT